MPLYELINPSDHYTFEARDTTLAGVVVMFLSSHYGAKQIEPDVESEKTPILFGWEEWFKERGVDLTSPAYVEENAEELARAFESFVIGDRAAYLRLLVAVPEAKRPEWIASWNNEHRSSLNDIGKSARHYAVQLRKKAAMVEGRKLGIK